MRSSIFKRQRPLYTMLLPGALLVFIFSYIPMFGVVIAFQKYYPAFGIRHSKWIGWDNFRYVLDMPDTRQVLWNTVIIALFKIVVNMLVPIVVALLLNEVVSQRFKKTVQTLIYLPHFLSWVILGGILVDILSPSHGIVNHVLGFFSVKPVFFLGDNHWFRTVLVTSDVWKEFGFNTIVYLAALTAINPTLYEAAYVDGANRWKQTLHVTLPGMAPIIVLMATLSIGNILNAGFDQVFNLYSPSVFQSGDILDTMIYRIGMQDAQFGVATAIGVFKSAVSIVVISAGYWCAYRLANYRIF
ncbi:ABC transporter permease [Cohnella sp. GCM10012308]|uniref:ABC transporter permease n=1 Tax=Cohnella sp. GCM10012308 TaxID=3317329 RepID=UPI00361A7734